jgi:DNA-binding CsgD family transcriptional regulator
LPTIERHGRHKEQGETYVGAERRRRPDLPALVVIDADCAVRLSFQDRRRSGETRRILSEDGGRLRPDIEAQIATFVGTTASDRKVHVLTVRTDDGLSLRVSTLVGHQEPMFALTVELDRDDGCLARAATKYQLTPRQTEVLGHILEGATAGEIALRLSISEYTAQGYIKSLLAKTGSRNRPGMVAKVLDWQRSLPRAAPIDDVRTLTGTLSR